MPEVGVGTVTIEPDMSGFRAAMAKEAGPAVDGLTRDINGRLRDSRGNFVKEAEGMGGAGGTAFASKFQAASMAGMAGTLKKMRTVGSQMTRAITLPLVGAAGLALKAGADFEKSMNVLQASTEATRDEMKALSDRAMALGDDLKLPGTSAKDAADAMLELSKAGLSVNDTLAAARGVLELSAAGQIDNATAANLTASALMAFNLEGSEATRIADLLAAGANESLASVEDMGQSMQMAASIFAAAGIPVEDMVTSIAQLANAGISGSDAGTSLKSMLMKLQAPSDKAAGVLGELGLNLYRADGSMKDFRTIIGEMSGAMVGLTQEQKDQALATVFGSDAIRSANILIGDGVAGFDAMKAKVTETGAAQKMAEAQTKGLSGAWDAISSALDTAAIKLTKRFLPFFTDLATGAADLIGQFTNLPGPVLLIVGGFAALAAVAGPLVYIVSALGTVIGFLLSPIGLILAGIALLTVGLVIAYQKFEGFRDIVDTVARYLRDQLLAAVDTVVQFWNDHLFPVLETFGRYLRDDVGPALATFGGLIRDEILPVVDRFKQYLWLLVAPVLILPAVLKAAYDKFETFREIVQTVFDIVDHLKLGLLFLIAPFIALPILIKTAYDRFEVFRDAVGTVTSFITDDLVPAFQHIFETARDFLMPILRDVGAYINDVLWPAFQTGVGIIRDHVLVVFGDVVRFLETYLLPIIQTVARFFVEVLWPNFQKAWDWILKAVQWAWENVLQPVFGFIGDIITNVLVPVFTFLAGVVAAVFVAIVAAIEVAWSIIKPVFEFIKDLIANVLLPVFIFLKNVIVDFVFPLITAIIRDAWDIIQPIFAKLIDLIDKHVMPVFGFLGDVVGAVFGGIKDVISAAWDFIKPIFDTIISFIADKLNPIWDGLVAAAKVAWEALPGLIQAALRGVGKLIAGFLGGVASIARAIGLNEIADALDSGADSARKWGMEKVETNSTPVGGHGRAFAGGGRIPGPNVNRDIVPILAMPGEFMIRKDAVDKFGAGFFAQLNAGQLPRFGLGGFLDPLDLLGKSRRFATRGLDVAWPELPVPDGILGFPAGGANHLREGVLGLIAGEAEGMRYGGLVHARTLASGPAFTQADSGFRIEHLEVTTPAGANVDELVGAISARLGWQHTTRRDR